MRKIKLIVYCILVFIILSSTIFGFKLLSNQSKYKMEDYESYALAGAVQLLLPDNGGYMKILSCYPEDGLIRLVIESNIPIDTITTDINSSFYIEDDNGTKGKLVIDDIFYNPSEYKWLLSTSLSIKGNPHNLKLKYDKYSIPIILINNESNHIHRNIFNISQLNDIRIGAFTQYIDDLFEVMLVPTGFDNSPSPIDFIVKDIVLVDMEGKLFHPIIKSDTTNTFYFETKIPGELYLDIYSADIYYNEGNLDKTFNTLTFSPGEWRILLR